jgi:hypothetical protein
MILASGHKDGQMLSFHLVKPCVARERIASATIPAAARPIVATHIMKLDLQDIALRTLILVAGGLAALVLALKGQGQALPALAVGGTLGAFMMARFGPTQQ